MNALHDPVDKKTEANALVVAAATTGGEPACLAFRSVRLHATGVRT